MEGDPCTPPRPVELNTPAIQMVEALWMLTYSSGLLLQESVRD